MTILQLLKQSDKFNTTKLVVRELDQEDKDYWVGFVDDDSKSFDVHIWLKGKQIVNMTCDCTESDNDLCAHRVCMLQAVNQQISGVKKTSKNNTLTKKKTSTKKLTPSALLLQETGQDQVYTWLLELFKKNKEVEQEFMLTFRKKEQLSYTVQDIEKIFDDIHKAVFGRRKSADAKDMKKYVDLLTLALKPVQDFMTMSMTKPICLEIYQYSAKRLYLLERQINYNSTRIETFAGKFADFYSLSILNIKDQTEQGIIIKNLFSTLYDSTDYHLETMSLELLVKLFSQLNDKSIKQAFSSEIIKLLKYFNKKNRFGEDVEQLYFFLIVLINTDDFKDNYHLFKPIRFENQYNLLFLEHLLVHDIELTQKYCLEIMDSNYHPFYNTPYIEILTEIYITTENYKGLAKLKATNFLTDPNLEDYLFIKQHLDDQNIFTKFRTKVLSTLRNSFSYYNDDNSNVELYFDILHSEQNYKKMLEVLNNDIPQTIIYCYAEQLQKENPLCFLNKVLEIGQYLTFNQIVEPKLADFITKHYSKEQITQAFKKYTANRRSLNELILNMIKEDNK
ncbi:hypothetical protein [Myroides pelagicus]|uniref:SWIM-type domain-containing protein n=1 Tax=Myroides pelagicus TaxID=270914 RepID=A0A7K1GQ51_9FLAO|nr:hypothetical protein [Myroides pelagicus]MTH31035.1 hypothetical protein [Myroides pelagicus]